MKNTILNVLALTFVLLLSGCGEKECFFVSQEGKQLETGAPVVWYDSYVGKVASLEQVADGTKVLISFNKKFNSEIRDGVAGRVVNDSNISPKAFVLLIGGRDKDRSLIAHGAQIPESKPTNAVSEGFSAFVEWLKNSRADELKIVGVVLLILLVILKFVSRVFKFIFFVGIVCAIAYVCLTTSFDWNNYKEKLTNVKETAQEAKNWLQDHGEKLHTILDTVLEAEQ